MGFRFLRPQIWSEWDRPNEWYGRLSAPGYLDCTDTNGPYATRREAALDLLELYGPEGLLDPEDLDSDDLAWFEWAVAEGIEAELGSEFCAAAAALLEQDAE